MLRDLTEAARASLVDLQRTKIDSSDVLSPYTRVPGPRLEVAAGNHVIRQKFSLSNVMT